MFLNLYIITKFNFDYEDDICNVLINIVYLYRF